MHHKFHRIHDAARRDGGFVLIVALILLLVLTLLGLAATQTTVLEERMAGNARNHDLAFQSAEAGLYAAQSAILQGLWSNANYAGNGNGLYMLATCCASGPAPSWTSAWTLHGVWGSALPADTAVPGLNIAEVSQQPVFIIEELPPVAPPGSNLGGQTGYNNGAPPSQPYRITAYAVGGDGTTHVTLQAVVTQ